MAWFLALKGRSKPAQGNALGLRVKERRALKGHWEICDTYIVSLSTYQRPFRAHPLTRGTQGGTLLALG